ncbi:helix-turn-helix transcriptional regulator [Ramlibacter sp. G-1-2-2]|uniref:Helix-turn-helix transcriptional regulator n=1 Tax=Ramlibacter agri TaxID=2728837 RepID=A0A848GY89_9BURK|nr:AraC family transcriptional regulator [Ramlibacter agri]NML42279.1 helix-turn-helix transcriptional regulator [Ramlibacter agri]
MSMPAPLSSALNQIWTPRASLSACVRAVMLRDTRGLALDDWQRLSYFPATPLCSLGWRFEGDAELVDAALPQREASPQDPRTPITPRLTLVGPFNAPSVVYSPGPSHGMMLLLMPDALQLLTGIEPAAIANRVVDALPLLPPEWRTWAEGLFWLPDDAARLAAIEAFLEPRWQAVRPTRASLAARYADWTRHLAMRAALTAPGRSLRQVERHIKRWAGQPMRELQGVSRLEQAFYARLAAEKENTARWSDVAADCGYADQAHFTRATRRMTGFPPDELRRRIRDHEGFWAYRLWM